MYSLANIRRMNDEATEKAVDSGARPCLLDAGDVHELQAGDDSVLENFQNVGRYLPEGWHRVRLDHFDPDSRGIYMGDNDGYGAYFVDSSGFGGSDEAALLIDEFIKRVKPGYGYAIVEAGQFQVKIGVFAYWEPDPEAEKSWDEFEANLN